MSDMEAVTKAELERWPGVACDFEMGGKHLKCRLRYGGKSRVVIAALTASDKRSGLNHVSQMRRELTAMGAQPVRQQKRQGPRPTRNKPTRHMQVEKAPVRENPFEALAAIKLPEPEVAPVPRLTIWQRLKAWMFSND